MSPPHLFSKGEVNAWCCKYCEVIEVSERKFEVLHVLLLWLPKNLWISSHPNITRIR